MPQWINSRDKRLVAHELGHPLLRDSQRVTNDISIEDNKPLWLITGSNMSGKSTFLRSLGINILLARTGSPVCAKQMELPPLILATSIRVRDSLDQGISYFMAELRRLKSVVDVAEQYERSEKYRVLFLLDEIMQGTNSRERHIAVGHVLHTLLTKGAFGAVSTHDLDLVSHPQLEPRCEVVHFREHIRETAEGKRMVFDYKMRQGPTPTTNALRLLALVGLGDLGDFAEKAIEGHESIGNSKG
jgi:DNA mismatch repair ATPase MutS